MCAARDAGHTHFPPRPSQAKGAMPVALKIPNVAHAASHRHLCRAFFIIVS
jgi:hypothetical protein